MTASPPRQPESESIGRPDTAADGQRLAVALEWTPNSETAPKIVATGRGVVAERILELAFANDVKVREDPDLINMLAAVDLGAEIPLEAFAAVAEILVYVYRANDSADENTDESPTIGTRRDAPTQQDSTSLKPKSASPIDIQAQQVRHGSR